MIGDNKYYYITNASNPAAPTMSNNCNNRMAEHGLAEIVNTSTATTTTTLYTDREVISSDSKHITTGLSKVQLVNNSTDIVVGQFADADQINVDNAKDVDMNSKNEDNRFRTTTCEQTVSTNRITVKLNDGHPNQANHEGLSSPSPSSSSSSPVETPDPSPLRSENDHHSPSLSEVIESPKASQSDPQLPVLVNLVGPAPVLRVEQLRDGDGGGGTSLVVTNYTSDEEGLGHAEMSDDGADDKEKLPEFVEPDKELQDKIVKQVEFYFSDVNILKDAFLLKHVRRNKQGYVSLKLITSFRKVKSLSRDYRVVAFSLKNGSTKLEVNDEGTKVRRVDPLPEYDETTPSRSVVVVNLPIENPVIESVAELFAKCGTITLIRILRPKGSIPPDVKKYSSKHPEIGTTLCAVVEFETYEAAKLACSTMNNTGDWRKGMRVVPLSAKKKEKEKKKSNSPNNINGDKDGRLEVDKRKKKVGRKKKRVDELSRENESSCYSSGSEADTPQSSLSPMSSLDPNKLSPATTPKSSPRSSPLSSPRTPRRKWITKKSPLAETDNSPRISPRVSPQISPESLRKKYENGETPASPWVQRRMKAAQQQQANGIPMNDKNNPASGRSPRGSPLMPRRVRMLDPGMVVRSPRGPDGTRGFCGGIGRGKVININNNTSEIIA